MVFPIVLRCEVRDLVVWFASYCVMKRIKTC